MAGCYHDKQDFKSNLNIEVAREGDILQEGHDLDEIECKKNPGHRGFIPFQDLTLENLPNEIRYREILDNIKTMGSRVVRLVVVKVKNGKQKREAGSGCVLKLFNKYLIVTNNHLVKTEEEVKHCTVEFHYDDDNRSGVLTSRGVKLDETCPFRDITYLTFHPIPDFLYKLDWKDDKHPYIVILYKDNQNKQSRVFVDSVSSKGRGFLDLNSSGINLMLLLWKDGSISYFKSSFLKFQPIPSNIQELTSIEIHIDEDDGNSRVIPGDVVKCGDEFVVELSESIFQDEVKKCRLVWNGEVISRGTRLYFNHVKTEEVCSGVDLELYLKLGSNNIWMFECDPIPRGSEVIRYNIPRLDNMCCIGHPHGSIKMVTFGRWCGDSLERFDNQYRHVTQPGTDCKCKEVGVRKYSCKTCPGSSGSSVLYLYQGMNASKILSHFMGEKVEELFPDGELIENINMAWSPKGLSQI